MAKIELIDKDNIKGFAARITGTESGHSFMFFIRPPRINVAQVSPDGQNIPDDKKVDWFKALSKAERLEVFRAINDTYSQYSLAALKTAAIGVVANPVAGAPADAQHYLFLAVNTERRGSDYFKDCAEQNMVNSATTIMRQRLGQSADADKKTPIKLEAIAISGYRPADANNSETTATCPCGKCTDMLAKVMEPKGEVYVLRRVPPLLKTTINSTATTFSGVGKTEIWDTTIEQLNRNRKIKLNDADAALQRTGLDRTVSNASRLSSQRHVEIDAVTQAWLEKASDIAKQNTLSGRVSVPELDAACDDKGNPDPSLVNRFMQRKIESALLNRLVGNRLQGNESAAKAFVENPKFKHIRCVVMRMDDNTMHYGLESDTPSDNALPNAEVNSLAHALESTGTHGVREVWAMELNPKKIKNGIMQTSQKEGLERLLKRRSRELPIDQIQFHFIPMNDGKLEKTATEDLFKRHTYTTDTIYPGLFTGTSNKAPKIAAKPKDGGDLPPK